MHRIETVSAKQASLHLDSLTRLLVDCVEGGASIGFMLPFEPGTAWTWWRGVIAAVERDAVALLIAFDEKGRVAGSVQIALDGPCNQRHRGDIKKLMVHPTQREQGLGAALMQAAETRAQERGLSLLTLDTAVGDAGERLYARLGWQRAGIIPRYAQWPDGRFCATAIFYKELAA
jgi:ribosomal protein S18 acetylase RimI-like enzyme